MMIIVDCCLFVVQWAIERFSFSFLMVRASREQSQVVRVNLPDTR